MSTYHGPSGETRTPSIQLPKLARCQLRYTRLSRFSLPRLVPGIFRVCGHSCGQPPISTQIQPAPKPPVRPCVKAFRAFATNAMDAAVDCPKPPALPTALYPVISFSLPRLVPGIFRVCGHSCGQPQISNQIRRTPKPHVRPCLKAFRAFAPRAVDESVDSPKAGALPAALHPVIFRHTPYFNTHRRVMQCFFRCDFLRFMLNSSCI